MFSEDKVVMTRVSPILNDMYYKALKLRRAKKLHRFTKFQNRKLLEEAKQKGLEPTRVKKHKKKAGCAHWFKPAEEFDAEDYYRDRIEYRCRDIKEEKLRK